MAKDPISTGDTDPEHWEHRFDDLSALVKKNAEIARKASQDAATGAAIKVMGEATRQQQETKHELLTAQRADRSAHDVLHNKVDTLSGQLTEVLTQLSKLQGAKLIQQGMTAFALAALLFILVKVLGG